jgi:hypothetical protein
MNLIEMQSEIEWLEDAVSKIDSPIVFCQEGKSCLMMSNKRYYWIVIELLGTKDSLQEKEWRDEDLITEY